MVKSFGRMFAGSERRVAQIRRELGYHPSKGFGLDVLTEKQKKERVAYCKRHKKDHFSNMVFSDEKPWVLGKRR